MNTLDINSFDIIWANSPDDVSSNVFTILALMALEKNEMCTTVWAFSFSVLGKAFESLHGSSSNKCSCGRSVHIQPH